MKFYKCKNLIKIFDFNLTAVYCNYSYIQFFKNGMYHNSKNASNVISINAHKYFYLNNKRYGFNDNFTKESWRKFAKMLVFK
jgi:hypothetical protein